MEKTNRRPRGEQDPRHFANRPVAVRDVHERHVRHHELERTIGEPGQRARVGRRNRAPVGRSRSRAGPTEPWGPRRSNASTDAAPDEANRRAR